MARYICRDRIIIIDKGTSMKIGCPKEIKNNENRVGVTTNAVCTYVQNGHEVFVEKGAGLGSSIDDQEYVKSRTKIKYGRRNMGIFDMIVKVKEPLESEYPLMKDNLLIYTYFHFAANEPLLKACLERKIISLAYETVAEAFNKLNIYKSADEVIK
jgi:alanine dehydrogenase